MISRRRAKEKQFAERSPPESSASDWRQLQLLLDKELSRLPEKYRTAIIFCNLEGQSVKEAARQLGCPQGLLYFARRINSRKTRERTVQAICNALGVSCEAFAEK